MSALALQGFGAAQAQQLAEASLDDLRDLTIEQLANLEVTSVSRRPETLRNAPAAIYVITQEDVVRSGGETLPEILRLAPNLEVGRIDSARYAISARGFNTFQSSNKLLVLIDGRSVYTPLYSGVFWDQQHVMLDDLERIEVISGPGGTLWGANAVNGVINVTTRSSAETQGLFTRASIGSLDHDLSVRYGGRLGEGATYRIYATGFDRSPTLFTTGAEANDGWNGVQGGFRADWGDLEDSWTLQGDIFSDEFDAPGTSEGGNLLGRYRRLFADGSRLEVQAYHSRASRESNGVFDTLNTTDIEFQHNFSLGDAHEIVWGGGHRVADSEFVNFQNFFGFERPERTLHVSNIFVQDQIALTDRLALTLGVKAEDHTFTDIELMPNARIAWRVTDDATLWAAVSRAVRTPSRIDRELSAPGIITPGGFQSELMTAYEAGYRAQPTADFAFSVSVYHQVYDGLRTSTLVPPTLFPARIGNGLDGEVQGIEAWSDYAITEHWRMSAGVNLIESNFELDPLSLDSNGSGEDPSYQIFLRSRLDLTENVDIDLDLRAIDELPESGVDAYVDLNARIGWQVTDALEFALVGRNLLDESHPESLDNAPFQEVRRGVQLSARWSY